LDLRLTRAEIRCDSQPESKRWAGLEGDTHTYRGFWQHEPGTCSIALNAPAESVLQFRVALAKQYRASPSRGRARAFVRVRGSDPKGEVRELARIDLAPDRESFVSSLRIPEEASELQFVLDDFEDGSSSSPLDWTDLVVESTNPDFAYGDAWTVDVETALSPFFAAAGIHERVPKRRFLVIGLDGANWELMQPLLDAGRCRT